MAAPCTARRPPTGCSKGGYQDLEEAGAGNRAPSRVAGKLSWLAGEEAENSLISFGTTLWASGTTRGWKATLSVRAEALALQNWTGYAMLWRFTPTGVGSGWRVNFASGGSGARPKAD